MLGFAEENNSGRPGQEGNPSRPWSVHRKLEFLQGLRLGRRVGRIVGVQPEHLRK
jgi:hypothetical protein